MAATNIAGINIDFGAIGGGVQVVAQIAALGLIVVIFLLFVRYILRFNKKIYIINGTRLQIDKGWQNNKKKEFTLLKFKHYICPYPQSEFMFLEGKKEAYVGLLKNESIAWCKVGETSMFIPQNINMMNFAVDMFARIDEATKLKQGFWDKYGHQIMWIATMAIFLVVIILILQKMDQVIALANNVLSIPKEAIKQNTQVLSALIPLGFKRFK